MLVFPLTLKIKMKTFVRLLSFLSILTIVSKYIELSIISTFWSPSSINDDGKHVNASDVGHSSISNMSDEH